MPEIAAELSRLQAAAAANKLAAEDVQGGTITVSNIGGLCRDGVHGSMGVHKYGHACRHA